MARPHTRTARVAGGRAVDSFGAVPQRHVPSGDGRRGESGGRMSDIAHRDRAAGQGALPAVPLSYFDNVKLLAWLLWRLLSVGHDSVSLKPR